MGSSKISLGATAHTGRLFPTSGKKRRRVQTHRRPKPRSAKSPPLPAKLEAELEALGAEQKELEALLAGGTPDYQKIAQASERYEQIRAQIDAKETRWLELSEI